MATDKELSDFLENVERRAFKQAIYAVRNEESALDIVQDAMIKLAEKYGDKPPQEIPPLFQRILQNTILDFFRREKLRSLWFTSFSAFNNNDSNDDFNILENLELKQQNPGTESCSDTFERQQILKIIDQEIQKLPSRQREAFLMRYWGEMDVAETASIMGCSESSVKTHCSRAVRALAKSLIAIGIQL